MDNKVDTQMEEHRRSAAAYLAQESLREGLAVLTLIIPVLRVFRHPIAFRSFNERQGNAPAPRPSCDRWSLNKLSGGCLSAVVDGGIRRVNPLSFQMKRAWRPH